MCSNCKIYGNLNLDSGKQDLPLVTISNNVSENLCIKKTVLFYVLCSYTNTLSLIRLSFKLFIVYMEQIMFIISLVQTVVKICFRNQM